MTKDARANLTIAAGIVAWGVLWLGGWIAGGLLFPAYEVPAMIGADIGWVAGLVTLCACLWLGDVR